jgi:hypothetical protein
MDWAAVMTFAVTIWGVVGLCELGFLTFSCSFVFVFFKVREGEDKN